MPHELRKDESRGLEAQRKVLGLHGVLFRCYDCSQCRTAHIFVDIHQLDHESAEDYQARRDELEDAIRHAHGPAAEVVLVERYPGFAVWAS
jgi:hypothetical protein